MSVLHDGFRLPSGDTHFAGIAELHRYQLDAREAAIPYLKGRELVIDGGAHVGIFARWFEAAFRHVLAIEPDRRNFDCLVANTGSRTRPVRAALGQLPGWGRLIRHAGGNSGDNRIERSPPPLDVASLDHAPIVTLDELLVEQGIGDLPVRLIKLDLQGGEAAALLGAQATLKRWSPVLLIEKDPRVPEMLQPDRDLEALGYARKAIIRKDQIWVHP